MKLNFLLAIALFFSLSNCGFAQSVVSTYAGTGIAGLTNGALSGSQFNKPFGICRDRNGVIYISDTYNNCIRKIEGGIVSTYAGTTVAGWNDGPALAAQFNQPVGICSDSSGNLYVTDFAGQRIRKISNSGIVSTIAGNGVEGYQEGADTIAQFDYPRGISIDINGNLFIADSWNHRIRKIDAATHEVSTYAGGGVVTGVGSPGGYVDAYDTSARFHTPSGVAIDSLGNVYVADAYNHRIRMIDPQRQVTTIAGSGTTGGFSDGSALSANLNTPTDLFYSFNGDLYIGDTYNNRVRKLSNGNLTTIAGNGTAGFINGASSTAEFNYIRGITATPNSDSLWVIDWNNHAIRLITVQPTGIADQLKNSFWVFPNPFQEKITIHLPERNSVVKIRIADISGKIIIEQEERNNSFVELNTNELPSGVYLLSIESSGFISRRAVVKI